MNKILCKIGIPLLLLLLLFAVIISMRNPLLEQGNLPWRTALMKQPFVLHLLHTYHSFRKLADILFFPYYFKSSQIPVYTLNIKTNNLAALNGKLPNDPVSGQFRNEDRLWVKAIFSAGDYKDEVKVRYRGTNANHWNSYQKSWRINFPKGHLFAGMQALNLIIPYDRQYMVEPLNFYRAQKLGLATVDMHFVRLKLNGEGMGVYIAYEQWSDEWLKKRPIPENATVLAGDDSREPGDTKLAANSVVAPTINGPAYLNSYTGTFQPADSLEILINLIERADDETFRRNIGQIFDLQKFYAYNVVQILANSQHNGTDFYLGNVIIIFNPANGKFELSPWDVEIGKSINEKDIYRDNFFNLSRRLFRFPEFREARNKLLAVYLDGANNLQDDLLFYDKLWQETKIDFYKDNAKLYNNFQLRQQIKFYRDQIINNFSMARAVLSYNVDYYKAAETDKSVQIQTRDSLLLAGGYSRFFEASYTIDEFIAANPQFRKRNAKTLVLPRGQYAIRRDIIIPIGLRAVIEPGTTLLLDKKVSIVSYSPIIMRGSSAQPIRFIRAVVDQAWGTMAVVNTGQQKSAVEYVEFDGGSGAVINGATFTGMLAVHNGNAEITNSVFKNSGDDDAFNLKYGRVLLSDSVLQDTFSDAVDIDFAEEGTVIKNNKFYRIGQGGGGKAIDGGGDAIDISWSNITIVDNAIENCVDKGISIGENSRPKISGMRIDRCDIGIAVKDSSAAEVINSQILNSRVGIAVYQKKKALNGGVIQLQNVDLVNNITDYEADNLSTINIVK